MNYLDQIKQIEEAEQKSFIKEHLNDESFLDEVLSNKEKLLPILLKNKIVPDKIYQNFSTNEEDLNFLVNNLIEYKYIPTTHFIDTLVLANQDSLVNNLLKHFPSIPVNLQFLMKLVNSNAQESAITLIKSKKEFQKLEVLFPLIKSKTEDEELLAIAIQYPEIKDYIVEKINQDSSHFSEKFATYFILNSDETSKLQLAVLCRIDLPFHAFHKALKEASRTQVSYGGRTKGNLIEIPWSDEIEAIDDDMCFRKVLITSAPKGSKFRIDWVKINPNDASEEELLTLVKNQQVSVSICDALLRCSLASIKQVDPEIFNEYMTPVRLTDIVGRDPQKTKYFFEKLSAKFKPALRKVLPDSFLEAKDTSKRKSYFNDIFLAIKENDFDSFKLYSNKGYSLEQFSEDSTQSSKSRSCEITSVGTDLLQKLSKEEFLALIPSKLRFSSFYGEDENLRFKLTLKECLTVQQHAKYSEVSLYKMCSEQEEFLLSKKIEKGDISTIFQYNRDQIMKDSKLFKAYLLRTKESDFSFDDDDIKAFAEIFTSKELKKMAPSKNNQSGELVLLTCKDNEYYLEESDLLQMATMKNLLESSTFIQSLLTRNPELGKRVVQAYLAGNKELSELTGQNVKIHRQNVPEMQDLFNTLNDNPEEVILKVFKKGGKLSEFRRQFNNWDEQLEKHGKGKTVSIEEFEKFDQLLAIAKKIPSLIVSVENYKVTHQDDKESIKKIKNLEIKNIEITSGNEELIVAALKLKKLYPSANITSLQFNLPILTALKLTRSGLIQANLRELVTQMNENPDFSGFSTQDIIDLTNNGLQLTDQIIQAIIDDATEQNGNIDFLFEKIGSLKGFIFNTRQSWRWSSNQEDLSEMIKKTGLLPLDEKGIKFLEFQKTILLSGPNFEPIQIKEYSTPEKTSLIKFIEKEVDQNYAKLNLLASNLDNIETLFPYNTMKTIHSLDESDIMSLFCIPKNVSANKKIMKGIQDILTIKSQALAYTVSLYKDAIAAVNSSIELSVDDFLDFSDQSNVKESDTLRSLSDDVLNLVRERNKSFHGEIAILRNKEKRGINRFLKTASIYGKNGVKDIFDMIDQTLSGLEDLKVQLTSNQNWTPRQIEDSNVVINGVRNRLEEIATIDEAEGMHDRLVILLQFIQQNESEPMGQDKYIPLENSQAFIKDTGVNVFFPKTKGDLVYLGDENGWCVNYNSSYFEGVQQRGNIMLGLCPADQPAVRENVIALVHFIKNTNGDYRLEQLRWSSKLKDGKKNEDASSDFNHANILSHVYGYLKEYELEQKKAKEAEDKANELAKKD
jgi:hypothetical protein